MIIDNIAKEVDSVGYVEYIELWNGSQTVKVLILDRKEGENRGVKASIGEIVAIAI
ncbi:baseplate J/gp47 family protein [Clostridium ihumii]|uniref:baseplate J/gp47 family protein n=1 Tax=Clostridium ihumii TaxID=1470356 RepID=UPI003D3423C7